MDMAEILSSYIEARDSAKTNGSLFVGKSTMSRMDQFNRMVNGHAAELTGEIERLMNRSMNLPEIEAFAELANARLNYLRMNIIK
jgi:hypothetical protein